MGVPESEQLLLPIEYRPPRLVELYHVEQKSWQIGRKVLRLPLWGADPQAEVTTIPVNQIDELSDPQLRYALRFAAAADSAGSLKNSEYSSHSNFVSVYAYRSEQNVHFAYANYTGVGESQNDTFMADLKSFKPSTNEDI